MSKTNVNHNGELETGQRRQLSRRLDAVGWGLFFIWMGIALLTHVGWGVGLLGVGIITLGCQAARRHYILKLEGFWVVVGLFFFFGGFWDLFIRQS